MEANINTIAIALAVFALTWGYIPSGFLFRHQAKGMLMIKKFLGIIGITSAVVLIVWGLKTIYDALTEYGISISPQSHTQGIWIGIGLFLAVLIGSAITIRYLWRLAQKIPDSAVDGSSSWGSNDKQGTGKTNQSLNIDISLSIDPSKLNKQQMDFTSKTVDKLQDK